MSLRPNPLTLVIYIYMRVCSVTNWLQWVTLTSEYYLTSRDAKICLFIQTFNSHWIKVPLIHLKVAANLIPTAFILSDWFISPCYVQPAVNTSTFCKSLFSPFCLIITPALFHDKCVRISRKLHAYCFCHLSPPSTFALCYSLLCVVVSQWCEQMIICLDFCASFSCVFLVIPTIYKWALLADD